MQQKDSQQAEGVNILAQAAVEASKPGANTESQYECPFCVMMRKGGCEEAFKAFMECGEKADKGEMEMADCLTQFEQLHLCMEKNQAVFDSLLLEMKDEEERGKAAAAADGATSSSSAAQESATAAVSSVLSHQINEQQQAPHKTDAAASRGSNRQSQSSGSAGHVQQSQPALPPSSMAPAS